MPTIRTLIRRPGFSLAIITMFAIGIAASTAIFSVFNGMFLSSLPYPAADRLLYLNEAVPSRNIGEIGATFLDVQDWRAGNGTFDHIAGYYDGGGFNFSTGASTRRVHGASVTFDMAATLGIRAILGRDFVPGDDQTGAPKVVMLGYSLWHGEFGGSADVVGKIVWLDSVPYTVIGVLPSNVVFPAGNDFWIPRGSIMEDRTRVLTGIARLKAGMTIAQARADLARVQKIPGSRFSYFAGDVVVASLRERFLGSYRPVTKALFGAVGVLLLIACSNIAALMMARGTSRSRELAIRAALGAERHDLIRQLLVESFCLAAIGGIAGVGAGWLALRGMLSLMPDVLPAWVGFHLDARFAGFALALTFVAAMLSGLAPALESSHVDIRGFLSGANASASRMQSLGMKALVVGEIALTVVVLSGAGLVLAAFHKVMTVDPGFRGHNVVTFGFDLDQRYKRDQHAVFYRDLLTRLRAIPGVESAGAIDFMPFAEGRSVSMYFQAEGEPLPPIEQEPYVLVRSIVPGYLRAMGIAQTAGREFEERDGAEAIVVNEAFAAHFWPRGTNVVGRRVGMPRGKNARWLTVTGVVRDVRQNGLEQPVAPAVYVPSTLLDVSGMTVVMRSTVDPAALVASAREVIRELDPQLIMFDVQTMQERMDRSLWARRTYSWLFAVFAGIALLLAVAGIYGVVSYAVTQRTREIGIRVAVGARPEQVLGMVMREGMALAASGIAIGVLVAFASTRVLQSLLAGVSPREPWVFAGLSVILLLTALGANFVPAMRAAKVDPVQALKVD